MDESKGNVIGRGELRVDGEDGSISVRSRGWGGGGVEGEQVDSDSVSICGNSSQGEPDV